MSRELTEQFIQLLFDNDLIIGTHNQRDAVAIDLNAHYPNGSILKVHATKTNLVHLELIRYEKTELTTANLVDALEYVKRWSLDLDGGGVFVTSMDEAYSAARDLLEKMEGVDASAVDVKKFTAYITYPRVGNYSVHGLLVKLPKPSFYLAEIVRVCTHEA